MKTSLREFQRNASKYLGEMPIELTRYGRVVAEVVRPRRAGAREGVKCEVCSGDVAEFYEVWSEEENKNLVICDKCFRRWV